MSTRAQNTTHRFRFPWRSWTALLVGIAVAVGALVLTSQEARSGVRSSQVTVDDPRAFFDEEELRIAVSDVTWGRPVRLLLVIRPAADLPLDDTCALEPISCLKSVYPSWFRGVRVEDDAAVLWLDPETEIAAVRMGVDPQYEPDEFYQVEYDVSRVLTLRAAQGELSPLSIADAFQVLADAEAGVTAGPAWSDFLLAATAGALATVLTGLILHAAKQRRDQRLNRSPLAGTTRSDRRAIVDEVFENYAEATASLEEIALLGVVPAGDYQDIWDARISQYQRRYVQLARAVFDVQHHRDELSRSSYQAALARLHRLSVIVREAGAVLRADETVLSGTQEKNHPSAQHLRRAFEAAADLAAETGDEALATRLPDLALAAHDRAPLRRFDRLAAAFVSAADRAFIAYEVKHGHPYDRREEIEDPFRFRTLEMASTQAPPDRRRPASRSAERLRQRLTESLAEIDQTRPTRTIPISPIVILLAAALAIGAGGIFVWLNPVTSEISTAESAAIEIPETITRSDEERSGSLVVPGGEDFEELVPPSAVEVVDNAGIIADPDELEQALSLIPAPGDVRYLVLTTDVVLPERYGSPVEAGLAEIFPEHLERVGDDYAAVRAPDTIVIWFADSGAQVGTDRSTNISHTLDPDYDGFSAMLSVARSPYPTAETQAWDAFVAFSNSLRGIGLERSTATLTSGSANVTGAVVTALITFTALVLLLPLAIRPLVMRRRRNGWTEEIRATMTALTLAHDALSLEMTMVAREHPYDALSRFTRWDRDYRQALKTADSGQPLEEIIAVARTVRAQAESLWRLRPILELDPTWSYAWENDCSAIHAAIDSEAVDHDILTVTQNVADGSLTPAEGLNGLDQAAATDRLAARLRSLRTETRDSTDLHADAQALARTPVFSLAMRDDSGAAAEESPVSANQSVQSVIPYRSALPSFFSIDSSAMRWAETKAQSLVGAIRGLQSPSRITRTVAVYSGIALAGFIVLQVDGDDRDVVRVDVDRAEQPLSVTAVGEDIDDQLIDALESTELGMPVHLLVYASPDTCEYSFVDDLKPFAEEAPHSLRIVYDRVSLTESSAAICLSDESMYVRSASNVTVGEGLDGLAWSYRGRDEDAPPQDLLVDWVRDPDRGAAFEQHVLVVEQYDEIIR